ncbi:MAG: HAMP domain-containing sensor histidine kinase [Lachnospiraceae bacterium]|jgi:signal transduction histidine kinase
MRNPLYLKFVLAYVLLAIAGFITICTLGSHLIENHLTDRCSSGLYREATTVASSYGAKYYNKETTLENMYDNLVTLSAYQNSQIWIVSPEGEILVDTSMPLDPEHPQTIEGFDPASFSNTYYRIGDFYGHFQEDTLSVIAPITTRMAIKGYIAMHLPAASIYQQREEILGQITILGSVMFLLSLIILLIFSYFVYIPLKKIITGVDHFTSGDLKYTIPVNTADEMGYLAASLNYMSDELDQVNDSQRKFVANVSHDFRSPLTSIKGYAEAILDGTIPPEMQNKYLGIIVFETERLHKLTESLLTLNNINDKGRLLNITSFDINYVIKNTAATFEGTCRDKKISIDLLLSAEHLYVSADMVGIQQVLYNLLDNAIKFSFKESVITVETTEKQNTVFVSIKDTGIGIPKDSIPKIWDRFYKTDSSRGKDQKGTGLGLAIVKEIINAHNQHINIISTEGVGTEFIFTLDRAKQQGK